MHWWILPLIIHNFGYPSKKAIQNLIKIFKRWRVMAESTEHNNNNNNNKDL